MKHRLDPINEPFSNEATQLLKNYPQQDGYILKLFRVFANSLRFLSGKGIINFLDDDSPISLRHREIVILRVCSNNNCEYEWGIHATIFAKKAELTDQQIAMTRLGTANENCWSDEESLLISIIDELCKSGSMSNQNIELFSELWDKPQQLEILALCGNYHTISYVANVSQVSPEAFAATFPA